MFTVTVRQELTWSLTSQLVVLAGRLKPQALHQPKEMAILALLTTRLGYL